MLNFRVAIVVLAITAYFIARAVFSSPNKENEPVSVHEYQVKFYNVKR